ncbi:MAG: hypothetical protein EOP82_27515 [Variovorax sp.]|nr:MAG: hypothetical protein EOP82_27515 [Variovorax sp.]
MDTHPLVDRFDHEGWQVCVYVMWDGLERRFTGRAELFLDHALRCRINLPWGIDSQDEATASLQRRSREFIADWRQREHNADSEFSEL